MKRWFMSYVQVYQRGAVRYGHCVLESEHPLAAAQRWSETYGAEEHFQTVLLNFFEVGSETPAADVLSHDIN